NQKTDNPYYATTFTLQPSWALDDTISVSLSYGLTYEWTYLVTPCHAASGPRAAGAPAEDCSASDDFGAARFDQTDLELGIADSAIYVLGPVTFSGNAGLGLPTSRTSRYTSNLFTLALGGAASLALEPVTIGLDLSFRKFFPTASAQVLDA